MKTKLSIFLLSMIMLSACSKNDAEDVTDCIGQSLLTIVSHDAVADNPKKIAFSVTHSDDPKIKSITWDFGDNMTESSNSATITHTYTQAGSYQVKLKVYLDNSCSYDKTQNVTVK